MESVFAKYESKAYPHRFEITLHAECIAGGVPSDPKTAEGWLKTKLADRDDLIRQAVAEVMVERNISAEEATEYVDRLKHLNGFRKDEQGLYLAGYQLKAAIKEAACIKWPKERWGPSSKGTFGYFAEHVFVVENRLHLGLSEPSGVAQHFPHTWRGNGIQYVQYIEDAKLTATIETDVDFPATKWADLWLTGQRQGLGAMRSQGYGRYTVVGWSPLK